MSPHLELIFAGKFVVQGFCLGFIALCGVLTGLIGYTFVNIWTLLSVGPTLKMELQVPKCNGGGCEVPWTLWSVSLFTNVVVLSILV